MAVKKLMNFSCPFCGGTEFVKGRACSRGTVNFQPLGASALIAPIHGSFLSIRKNTQTEIRVYCKNCGSLVREYIRNPELLEK